MWKINTKEIIKVNQNNIIKKKLIKGREAKKTRLKKKERKRQKEKK